MLKELKKNEKGIVFITVLMVIIIMAVLTVSIVNLNVNQALITEGEVSRIQLEAAAMGALSYMYANLASTSPSPTNLINYQMNLSGQMYNVVANLWGPGLSGTNTNTLNIYITPIP